MDQISNNFSIQNISKLNICIIGAGFMGTSIAKGLTESFADMNVTINDIDIDKLDLIKSKININVSDNNPDSVKNSNIVIFTVKPNVIPTVLDEIKDVATRDKLIISLCAGISLDMLQSYLPNSPIIRVMPNICAQIQEGAIAYSLGKSVTHKQKDIAHKILSSMGLAFCVEEKMLDAVTGLSGSGPAYIFMAIEALSDGGVLCGLPRNISNKLAAQTVYGAAKMYLQTNCHAGTLKDMVTSPGGTTIQGVKALEEGSFRSALINAVEKATEQSKKLGKK